jgi:enoyl-[acyl-carrier protein] reductase I
MTTPINVAGKRGLIVGIANEHSIAWGCADILHQGGAELALTYQGEKAKPYVEPLAKRVNAPLFMPLDVTKPEQMQAVFDAIQKEWGKLDFVIHSIAYAPKADLHGRVVDSSAEGFLLATDISCHSFLRLAKHAEPLMKDGGSLLTMSYYGAEKVIPDYSIMGPIKAMLEFAVDYLAVELGKQAIRVNAISPGAMPTRAASGLKGFDQLMQASEVKSPLHQTVSLDDVGHMAAFLVSDLSKNITGGTHYVDAGYEVMD